MKKQCLSLIVAVSVMFTFSIPSSYAVDKVPATEPNPVIAGAASGVLPPTGQILVNKEGVNGKTVFMATVEATAIVALVLTATLVGGPIVWVGIGPLMANHIWSGTEAFATAEREKKEWQEQHEHVVPAHIVTAPVPTAQSSQPRTKDEEEDQKRK